MLWHKQAPLTESERRFRIGGCLAISLLLVLVFLINPTALKTSGISLCPFFNMTGLPCLLCGGTRAAHYFLRGDWSQALYYNWIAIPAVLGMVVLVGKWLRELHDGFLRCWSMEWFWRSSAIWFWVIVAIGLWGWHIYEAWSYPKPELLNRSAFLVRYLETRSLEEGK